MESTSKGESVLDVLARMKGELSFDVDEFVEPDGSATTGVGLPKTVVASTHDGRPQKKSTAEAAPGAAEKLATACCTGTDTVEKVEEVSDYLGGLLSRYDSKATPVAEEPSPPSGPSAALPRKKVRPQPTPIADPLETDDSVPAASERTDAQTASPDGSSLLDPTPGDASLNDQSELLDQQGFVPRKRAPEEKACIDAMRELAVHSARKAIQVCDNKRRGFDAKHRLGLAATAFAVSGVALMMADHLFSFLGTIALSGVVIGCVFVVNWQKTMALVKKSN